MLVGARSPLRGEHESTGVLATRLHENLRSRELVPAGTNRLRGPAARGRTPAAHLSPRRWRRGFPPRGLPARSRRHLHLRARYFRCGAGRAQQRLGARQRQVRWIEADVTGEWAVPRVDIWHDRAVFHFLTDAEDRARYRERLLQSPAARRVGHHCDVRAARSGDLQRAGDGAVLSRAAGGRIGRCLPSARHRARGALDAVRYDPGILVYAGSRSSGDRAVCPSALPGRNAGLQTAAAWPGRNHWGLNDGTKPAVPAHFPKQAYPAHTDRARRKPAASRNTTWLRITRPPGGRLGSSFVPVIDRSSRLPDSGRTH